MMGKKPALSLGLAALFVIGCGDDPVGPAVEQNNPGTGTRNMLVQGDIEAEDVAGGFVTTFEVKLRNQAGQPVSGATVVVRAGGAGTLNLLEMDAGSGEYRAQLNSFPKGDFRLDAASGDSMKVQGVVVGGIEQHAITAPSANDTIVAGEPLLIKWTRAAEARGADIETKDFEVEGIPDSGSFTVPGQENPARDDQRVRVWRFNRVDIDGGLFGSVLKLSIRNTIEPIVAL